MPFSHLSVSLPYWQNRAPLDALAVAESADRLGYHRLWVGEMATFDAFSVATAIGRDSGRIPLCLGPLAVDVRTPANIAMGAASVAALTGRRVDVALGTSSTVVVRDWHGRRRRSTARHLEETTHIVRALLAGDKVEYDGRLEQVRGFRLRLPALRTPDHTGAGGEIVVAAFGERALEVAARCADRVVLNLVTPAQVVRCVGAIADFAAAAGRPAPPVSVWVTAAADPTPDLFATVRQAVVGYLRAPGYDAMFTEAGFGATVRLAHSGAHPREILAAITDELPATVGMFGDAAALAQRLSAYRDAGANEIVLVPATSAEDPAGEHTLSTIAELAIRRRSDAGAATDGSADAGVGGPSSGRVRPPVVPVGDDGDEIDARRAALLLDAADGHAADDEGPR